MAASFEADAVDRVVHFGHARNLRDLLAERGCLLRDRSISQPKLFACARRSRIMSPTITHSRAEQMARGSARQADRTRARHIHNRTWTDAGRYGAVIAGREDVGQQRQVA